MHKLVEIKGVGEVLARAFAEKGFHRVEDIADATEADLVKVSGVSTVRAVHLIRSAKSLLADGAAPEKPPQPYAASSDRAPLQSPQGLAGKKAQGAPCRTDAPMDDSDARPKTAGVVPAQSEADSSTHATISLAAPDKAKKKKKGAKSKSAKHKEAEAKGKGKGKGKGKDKKKKSEKKKKAKNLKKKKKGKQKSKEKSGKKKTKKTKKK